MGARSKGPTMIDTDGSRAKMTIMAANHPLLFDSAYARRAEKARNQFGSALQLIYRGPRTHY